MRLRRTGQVLDERYQIEQLFGEGSVGLVYRAVDLHLARPVAVKILREETAHGEILERFFREARVLSRLAHPNVISVADFGLAPPPGTKGKARNEGEGTPYLVMELLEGRLLEEEVDKGPLGVGRSLGIARQLLSALVYAHDQGVVHRDLKAGNLWLTDSIGRPDHLKVLDFGLARIVDPNDEEGQAGFTRRGYVYGSPEYLSPEQAAGDVADARSDLYSAGVVLFEMLTGRLPFESPDSNIVMQRHMLAAPPRVRDMPGGADVPEEVEAIVARALKKGRADRWQDARSFLAAVEDAEVRHAPPPTRTSSPPPAAVAAPAPAATLAPTAPLHAPIALAPVLPVLTPRRRSSLWWWLAALVAAALAAAASAAWFLQLQL